MLKKKILIIDDQKESATLTKIRLEETGKYEAHIETDGTRANEAVRKVKPDLILLDLMMPEVSGFKICKDLKAKERSAAIPIIILSAKTDKSDKVSGLDTGADDYIVKPFLPDELDARIRAVLRRSLPKGQEGLVAVGKILAIDPEKRLGLRLHLDLLVVNAEFGLVAPARYPEIQREFQRMG